MLSLRTIFFFPPKSSYNSIIIPRTALYSWQVNSYPFIACAFLPPLGTVSFLSDKLKTSLTSATCIVRLCYWYFPTRMRNNFIENIHSLWQDIKDTVQLVLIVAWAHEFCLSDTSLSSKGQQNIGNPRLSYFLTHTHRTVDIFSQRKELILLVAIPCFMLIFLSPRDFLFIFFQNQNSLKNTASSLHLESCRWFCSMQKGISSIKRTVTNKLFLII